MYRKIAFVVVVILMLGILQFLNVYIPSFAVVLEYLFGEPNMFSRILVAIIGILILMAYYLIFKDRE